MNEKEQTIINSSEDDQEIIRQLLSIRDNKPGINKNQYTPLPTDVPVTMCGWNFSYAKYCAVCFADYSQVESVMEFVHCDTCNCCEHCGTTDEDCGYDEVSTYCKQCHTENPPILINPVFNFEYMTMTEAVIEEQAKLLAKSFDSLIINGDIYERNEAS